MAGDDEDHPFERTVQMNEQSGVMDQAPTSETFRMSPKALRDAVKKKATPFEGAPAAQAAPPKLTDDERRALQAEGEAGTTKGRTPRRTLAIQTPETPDASPKHVTPWDAEPGSAAPPEAAPPEATPPETSSAAARPPAATHTTRREAAPLIAVPNSTAAPFEGVRRSSQARREASRHLAELMTTEDDTLARFGKRRVASELSDEDTRYLRDVLAGLGELLQEANAGDRDALKQVWHAMLPAIKRSLDN